MLIKIDTLFDGPTWINANMIMEVSQNPSGTMILLNVPDLQDKGSYLYYLVKNPIAEILEIVGSVK